MTVTAGSGGPHPLDQHPEIAKAALRATSCGFAGKLRELRAQRVEGLPCGVADGFERRAHGHRVALEHVQSDPGLHRDHSESVAYAVMQVLGHPQLFLGRCPLRPLDPHLSPASQQRADGPTCRHAAHVRGDGPQGLAQIEVRQHPHTWTMLTTPTPAPTTGSQRAGGRRAATRNAAAASVR